MGAEIYGNGVGMTEKVLDYLWGRQAVTMNNIANADTPGFKSQYITFEDELEQRISKALRREPVGKQAGAQAIDQTGAKLRTTVTESTRLDGNNVDTDQEMVDLVRTAYEYQYMVASLTNDITRMRTAAKSF